MKTVGFVVSNHGNGHQVRCGALAQELFARGWAIADEPDVWVIDSPSVVNWNPHHVVSIVDTPISYQQAELMVCGSPGGRLEDFLGLAQRVMVGAKYALLRPEFRNAKWRGGGETLDLRDVRDMGAVELARAMATAKLVITHGGMRAVEAACVGAPLAIHPRNEGEELNAKGLLAGCVVDGYGCQRVADAIEELFR